MRGVLRTLAVGVAIALLVAALEKAQRMPEPAVPFNAPEPHAIHGNGTVNIDTIRVPPNTILTWSCPQCGPATSYWAGATFQVFNDETDPQLILMGINALGQRSGTEVLNGGTYHNVVVETATDRWSLTFTREKGIS